MDGNFDFLHRYCTVRTTAQRNMRAAGQQAPKQLTRAHTARTTTHSPAPRSPTRAKVCDTASRRRLLIPASGMRWIRHGSVGSLRCSKVNQARARFGGAPKVGGALEWTGNKETGDLTQWKSHQEEPLHSFSEVKRGAGTNRRDGIEHWTNKKLTNAQCTSASLSGD